MIEFKTKKELLDAGFIVVPRKNFTEKEEIDARTPWVDPDASSESFYSAEQHWSKMIAQFVKKNKIKSVFEYGCNSGRNLISIKDLCPEVEVSGCDINPLAVTAARGMDLNVVLSGPNYIDTLLKNGHYDMVLTVSFLDHVPDPEKYIEVFAHMTNKLIFMLEIKMPMEGRIERFLNQSSGKMQGHSKPTYSWDYKKMAKKTRGIKSCHESKYLLDGVASGAYYKKFVART